MTNEEALSILHCPDTVGGLYSEKYGEALSMAMEALKREPCEKYNITHNENGYHIHGKPYHFNGDLIQPLYHSCSSYTDCIKWIYNRIFEQAPCEDCISRQAAIEAMGEQPLNWTDTPEEIVEEKMWEDHVKALKELPSVTPARPKGKWIYLNDEIEIYDHWYQCSVCHKESFEHRFCPYCGAEMVGTTRRD